MSVMRLVWCCLRSGAGCKLLVWGVGRDSAAWAALNAGTSSQSQQHDPVDDAEQSQLSGKERCRTVFVEDNPGWVSGTKPSACIILVWNSLIK